MLKPKRSHSIHMSSIEIDSKGLEVVIHYQFKNIKLSFFTSHTSFPLCILKQFRSLYVNDRPDPITSG